MGNQDSSFTISDDQLHAHLRRRMEQRDVSREDIERTLREGWEAGDAKPGTEGRTYVVDFQDEWEGSFYEEKEGTVYFKQETDDIVLLTVIARYGKDFPRGEAP